MPLSTVPRSLRTAVLFLSRGCGLMRSDEGRELLSGWAPTCSAPQAISLHGHPTHTPHTRTNTDMHAHRGKHTHTHTHSCEHTLSYLHLSPQCHRPKKALWSQFAMSSLSTSSLLQCQCISTIQPLLQYLSFRYYFLKYVLHFKNS